MEPEELSLSIDYSKLILDGIGYFVPVEPNEALTDFEIERLRYKMGGDKGIHFPEHDPHFQLDPNS